MICLNISSKYVYVRNWRAKYFVGTKFYVKCVSLNFGELECNVVRTIVVAYGCEWPVVLIGSLTGQRKCKHIVGGATQVVELIARLDVNVH